MGREPQASNDVSAILNIHPATIQRKIKRFQNIAKLQAAVAHTINTQPSLPVQVTVVRTQAAFPHSISGQSPFQMNVNQFLHNQQPHEMHAGPSYQQPMPFLTGAYQQAPVYYPDPFMSHHHLGHQRQMVPSHVNGLINIQHRPMAYQFDPGQQVIPIFGPPPFNMGICQPFLNTGPTYYPSAPVSVNPQVGQQQVPVRFHQRGPRMEGQINPSLGRQIHHPYHIEQHGPPVKVELSAHQKGLVHFIRGPAETADYQRYLTDSSSDTRVLATSATWSNTNTTPNSTLPTPTKSIIALPLTEAVFKTELEVVWEAKRAEEARIQLLSFSEYFPEGFSAPQSDLHDQITCCTEDNDHCSNIKQDRMQAGRRRSISAESSWISFDHSQLGKVLHHTHTHVHVDKKRSGMGEITLIHSTEAARAADHCSLRRSKSTLDLPSIFCD
ncbi:uncharacterized protein IL334_000866 [Kwoniella shivajii]|uniref:HTH psq-type domain-containing protein n=1 Tax=Kwoniella shivajii TaxID=564305 RepID=A0ABZ1CQC9_9TREE|nr:hypothetical protein IL334_000866 [Kwoniella shivajii]